MMKKTSGIDPIGTWPTQAFSLMIALACIAALPACAQNPDGSAASPSTELFWHEVPTLVPIQMVLPKGFVRENPHTLVVALHGYGSSATEFRRIADELAAAGFVVALPEATYSMAIGAGVGYDWTLTQQDDPALGERATRLLASKYLPATVREIRGRYAIKDVYVLGFSQGAVVALLTGIYNPSVFRGVISFGLPVFDPSWIAPDAPTTGRGVHVLLVHGHQDERAPRSVSERTGAHFKQAGYNVSLRIFEGGHTVPSAELARAAQWISSGDAEMGR